jgi:hypothetical protein
MDHRLWQDGAGESGGLSTDQVSGALQRNRRKSAGLRRQGAWELERTGDTAHSGARIHRIRPGCLPAAGDDFGAHLYRLRNSEPYPKRNTSYQPTRPTPIPIGQRRKPQQQGTPGYLRIDTVHQGDHQGRKGLYHINAVDQVTQWEIVAATSQIFELWLLPVLEALLEQFPFKIRGFHSDNGSEW